MNNYDDFSERIFCCNIQSSCIENENSGIEIVCGGYTRLESRLNYSILFAENKKIFVECENSSLDYNYLFFHRLFAPSINISFSQCNEHTNNLLNVNSSIVKQHIIC